jgi:hypothetical protein
MPNGVAPQPATRDTPPKIDAALSETDGPSEPREVAAQHPNADHSAGAT